MSVRQLCVCGATFTAPTIDAVWELFDQHIDEHHGRRFPRGALPSAMGRNPNHREFAPKTTQGRR